MAQDLIDTRSQPAQPPALKVPVYVWMAILMAAGLYFRVPDDVSQYYNMDEAMHANIASADSFADVLQFSRYEIHPPLYYIALHYWMMIGSGPAFARAFSLLCGMLLIPLYYLIGKRVGGVRCGLACASIITLSHGCIFQSYVVRQYSLLLLFISLHFYGWLCWRESRRHALLMACVVCGWLAALSHFSAIFYILAIALFETGDLLRKKRYRLLFAQWLPANLAIAALAVWIYHLWQPIILSHKAYFDSVMWTPALLRQRIAVMLSAPFMEGSYIYSTFPLLFVIGVYALLPLSPETSGDRNSLRPYLILAGVGCLVSVLLYACGVYMTIGSRHNLWMLPLIIPAAGGIAADLTRRKQIYVRTVATLAVLAALFEMSDRYRDRGELSGWSSLQRYEVTTFLKSLGPRDLVDMVKYNGVAFSNLYRYMGDDAFTGAHMSALAPYGNTHILFNPYYPNDYDESVMLATLEDANKRHMLDAVDRVIFVQEFGRMSVTNLMLCPALQKQVMTSPPLKKFPPGHVLNWRDLNGKITIMTISMQVLERDLLSPDGKARVCLGAKHGKVPGIAARQLKP